MEFMKKPICIFVSAAISAMLWVLSFSKSSISSICAFLEGATATPSCHVAPPHISSIIRVLLPLLLLLCWCCCGACWNWGVCGGTSIAVGCQRQLHQHTHTSESTIQAALSSPTLDDTATGATAP